MRLKMFARLLLVMLLVMPTAGICMAEAADYQQSWNADDIAVGRIDSYNGLTIIQPQGSAEQLDPICVVPSYRNYGDREFTRAINTGGISVVGSNYVPTARAIQISVPQPCYMTMYVYGATTEQNQVVKISRSGYMADSFSIDLNEKEKHITYLNAAGTYYIYSTEGSLGVHYISLHMINGDLNYDEDVEWDDLRIFRKRMAYQSQYSQQEISEMDINKNTVLDWNDYTTLENIIENKGNYVSQFSNNKVWNVSDMPIGEYGNYDGLEFVGAAENMNTLEIGSSAKTYGNRSFTKRIKTGGKGEAAFGNYLYNRAVKINVSSPCYMIIYMTNSTSNAVNPKAVISSEDGVVEEMALENSAIKKYVVRLEKTDSYYLYGKSNSLGVYYIELSNTMTGDLATVTASKTINAVSGESYEYALTVDKARYPSVMTYVVSYDASKLRAKAIGIWAEPGSGSGIVTDDDIEILYNSGGVIKFRMNTSDENWSGVLTKVKFTGIGNGAATIQFGIE